MKTGSVGSGLVDRDSSIPGKHFAPDYKQHSPSIPNGNPSATRASTQGRWQTSKQKTEGGLSQHQVSVRREAAHIRAPRFELVQMVQTFLRTEREGLS
jgi:hypothetical protein